MKRQLVVVRRVALLQRANRVIGTRRERLIYVEEKLIGGAQFQIAS